MGQRQAKPGRQAALQYAAEAFLWPGRYLRSIELAQQAADDVLADDRWVAAVPQIGKVTLRATRKPAYAGTTHRSRRLITLAEDLFAGWGAPQTLLLHELAHLASPVGGHGPVFRARLLWLLEDFADDDGWAGFAGHQVARLRLGLAAGGLRVACGGVAGVVGPGGPAVRWEVPAVPPGLEVAFELARAGASVVDVDEHVSRALLFPSAPPAALDEAFALARSERG